MNYIINPAVFYWMSVLDTLHNVLCMAIITSTILLIISAIALPVAISNIEQFPHISEGEKKRVPVYRSALKILPIIIIASSVIFVFIPSRETMVQILVAKFATYDNANWTLETIKSAVDYIVEAIKSLK